MIRENQWYKDLVLYQIYPRSFKDSNGDGVGDLPGILAQMDYLQDLGVNGIWLSPIYASPNVDNGYDVADYKAIHPDYGTFEDWERLRDGCHERGIALIMDLVVNHTSDDCQWFQESKKSKDNPYSDYYIWRDGVNGGPPNNWAAVFGGSAWEYCQARGQYYLHLFDKRQPDLNWACEAVREEVYSMLEWWIDNGVDGFRVDAISYLEKPDTFTDAPLTDKGNAPMGTAVLANWPKTHDYIREMNQRVFAPRNVMTVGEVTCNTEQDLWNYVAAERQEFNMAIPFVPPIVEIRTWSPAKMRDNIWQTYQTLKEDGWWARFFSNHDKPRQVSLYGDDERWWKESAKMLATLLHTLPGTPFIYQGEEIGMTNIYFDTIDKYDDIDTRQLYEKMVAQGKDKEKALQIARKVSRDNARSPMQWDATQNAGFTSGTPWLPVNPNYGSINVAAQQNDPDSILSYYRALTRLRRQHPVMAHGDFAPVLWDSDSLLAYTRSLGEESWLVLLNFCGKATEIDLAEKNFSGRILLSNTGRTGSLTGKAVLTPYEAVVLACR